MGQRTKSLLYLIPLAIPFIVMFIFVPSSTIQTFSPLLRTSPGPITTGAINGFSINSPLPPIPATSFIVSAAPIPTVSVLSVTGILCLIGLIAGGFFALSMLAADDRAARKILHVISLSPDEHQWLQTKVEELSNKLAIVTPKIGVVEDLRPNAFTIGYGENATIVFSIGLLKILDHDEVAAVAAHELGHVKHYDFFYKTLTSALTVVSFFNPLAYIVSSNGQREREMYADERAIELSEKPAALGNALAKICKSIESLPRENMLVSFSSNLLVTSSVLHRLGILSTHPRLDIRLRNISEQKPSGNLNHPNLFLVSALTLILLCSAMAVGFAMINLQTIYTSSQQLKLPSADFKTTAYSVSGSTDFGPSCVVMESSTKPWIMMNAPIHQAFPYMNNNEMFFVVNNGTTVTSSGSPVYSVFVVHPKNASFDS
ncbi:MAG TPA: M48 family metalloprotease [Candidatus Acidoferrum sp.]|nr:M48 family metalloprotease [Candidatus Acidoferrum sp.]